MLLPLVLDRLNRGEEAIEDLTRALSVDPNSLSTLLARARQFSKLGDVMRAIDDYNAADRACVQASPQRAQDPAILFGRGMWYVVVSSHLYTATNAN
jgi:Tfp pilus assembly protein PilF